MCVLVKKWIDIFEINIGYVNKCQIVIPLVASTVSNCNFLKRNVVIFTQTYSIIFQVCLLFLLFYERLMMAKEWLWKKILFWPIIEALLFFFRRSIARFRNDRRFTTLSSYFNDRFLRVRGKEGKRERKRERRNTRWALTTEASRKQRTTAGVGI